MTMRGATTTRIASSKGPGMGKAPMPAAHLRGLGIRRSRAMSFPALSVLAMKAGALRTPANLRHEGTARRLGHGHGGHGLHHALRAVLGAGDRGLLTPEAES